MGMNALTTGLVDRLPERLWWLGNTYRAFGMTVHFCVSEDGKRTVEWNGREVGRGNRAFAEFRPAPSERARRILWTVDFVWLATIVGVVAVVLLIVRRR